MPRDIEWLPSTYVGEIEQAVRDGRMPIRVLAAWHQHNTMAAHGPDWVYAKIARLGYIPYTGEAKDVVIQKRTPARWSALDSNGDRIWESKEQWESEQPIYHGGPEQRGSSKAEIAAFEAKCGRICGYEYMSLGARLSLTLGVSDDKN